MEQCIDFVEYVLLENGMIQEKFTEEERKIMEKEYKQFIKDQND